VIKEEKILKEGLEKAPDKQDNNFWISCPALWIFIGCSPFRAEVSPRFL